LGGKEIKNQGGKPVASPALGTHLNVGGRGNKREKFKGRIKRTMGPRERNPKKKHLDSKHGKIWQSNLRKSHGG